MKVKSTGLGKTTLTAKFTDLQPTADGDVPGLMLKVESTEPVHWYITNYVTAENMAQFARLLLRPANLRCLLGMLLQHTWSGRLFRRMRRKKEATASEVRAA